MKTLLPCPKCNQFFLPPPSLIDGAMLQCPGCGYQSNADSLFIEIAPNASTWLTVAEPGLNSVDNMLIIQPDHESLRGEDQGERVEENFPGVLAEDNYSSIDEDHGFLANSQIVEELLPTDQRLGDLPTTTGLNVPLSNEWETQSASLDSQNSVAEESVVNESVLEEIVNETGEEEVQFRDDNSLLSEVEEDEIELMFEEDSIVHETNEEVDGSETALDSVHDTAFIDEDAAATSRLLDENATQEKDDRPFALAPLESKPKQEGRPDRWVYRDRPTRRRESSKRMLIQVIGGGFASVPVAILLMWYVLKKDPLKAGPAVANFVPWIVPSEFASGPAPAGINASATNEKSRTLPTVQVNETAAILKSEPMPNFKPLSSSGDPEGKPLADSVNDTKIDDELDSKELDLNTSEQTTSAAPSESIARLQIAIQSDATASDYPQEIFDAMKPIAEDLLALHQQDSPTFKIWQQAVNKAATPIVKDSGLLKSLRELTQVSIDKLTASRLASELALESGFNLIAIGDIIENEDGQVWIPAGSSGKLWKSTRIQVPKSTQISGKVNSVYMLIGAAEPTTAPNAETTTDFTVLVAVPR